MIIEDEIPEEIEDTPPEELEAKATVQVPPVEGMQWLMPQRPTVASETLEYTAKGPLYTVTATFVRTQTPNGWRVHGEGTLKVPLGKKGQAGFEADWLSGANAFMSYRELGPSPIEWRRTQIGFESVKPERDPMPALSDAKLAALGMPLFAAVDLLPMITDNWTSIGPLAGMFFAAGSKVYALLLVRKTELEIEARMLQADFSKEANERADEIFARLPWPEARTADLVWDPAQKAIGALSARLPMLGTVRIQFARRESK